MSEMANWIEKQNRKREKCTFDHAEWPAGHCVGSGSNGFDSWSVECVGGLLTYRDTTAETQKQMLEEQGRKDRLIIAARSRVLTDEENKLLLDYGSHIFVRHMQSFYQKDVDEAFNGLLLQQARLRAILNPPAAAQRKNCPFCGAAPA